MEIELARLLWAERGGAAALRELRQDADAWCGPWVLVPSTALAERSRDPREPYFSGEAIAARYVETPSKIESFR